LVGEGGGSSRTGKPNYILTKNEGGDRRVGGIKHHISGKKMENSRLMIQKKGLNPDVGGGDSEKKARPFPGSVLKKN